MNTHSNEFNFLSKNFLSLTFSKIFKYRNETNSKLQRGHSLSIGTKQYCLHKDLFLSTWKNMVFATKDLLLGEKKKKANKKI